MPKYIVKKDEEGFREWLRSISFVDKKGKLRPIELVDDDSPDPEGDREQNK